MHLNFSGRPASEAKALMSILVEVYATLQLDTQVFTSSSVLMSESSCQLHIDYKPTQLDSQARQGR